MTKERKDTITVLSAVAMLAFGCILTTIAFFLDPMGEIHDSVLWVLGQCFIYAGGCLGIASYARSAARHEVDERLRDFERHGHGRRRSAGIGDFDETTDNEEDTEYEND